MGTSAINLLLRRPKGAAVVRGRRPRAVRLTNGFRGSGRIPTFGTTNVPTVELERGERIRTGVRIGLIRWAYGRTQAGRTDRIGGVHNKYVKYGWKERGVA